MVYYACKYLINLNCSFPPFASDSETLVYQPHYYSPKAEEATQEEIECGRVVKRRVDHVKEHDSLSPSVVAEWKRTRLDRLLVEYLLRAGCYSTATKVDEV